MTHYQIQSFQHQQLHRKTKNKHFLEMVLVKSDTTSFLQKTFEKPIDKQTFV